MKTPWQKFFDEKVEKIFVEKSRVIDIGGGLRALKGRGNRSDPTREWLLPFIEKVDYKIFDPVDTYNPDIIGDVHNLPFPDNSEDAIICIAVLEHVENPIKAWQELYRVLKPGGYLFIYVPFLYYYHADVGYYKDYWRFTKDSIENLSSNFASIEINPVRGAFDTWVRLSPIGRLQFLTPLWFFIDMITGKINSKQVSGYNVFLTK